MNDDDLGAWLADLFTRADDEASGVDSAYQAIENAGLLNRVVLRRYQCRRGCVVGTVVKIGVRVLCRTRDYKFSPGMNAARSVESARARKTLDGSRHWPGHTFDVSALAEWGEGTGIEMNCRHVTHFATPADVLHDIAGITPGRPGAPILL